LERTAYRCACSTDKKDGLIYAVSVGSSSGPIQQQSVSVHVPIVGARQLREELKMDEKGLTTTHKKGPEQ
jgi:hypothetical protein